MPAHTKKNKSNETRENQISNCSAIELKGKKLAHNRKVLSEISNTSKQSKHNLVSEPFANGKKGVYFKKPNGNKLPIEVSKKTLDHSGEKTGNKIIDDLDKFYRNNLFLLTDYAPDVYRYLHILEEKFQLNEWPFNSNITESMRRDIVNWLLGIQTKLNLLQETVHLAVALMDRCVQTMSIIKAVNFKVLALSCLWLAAKYEEVFPLSVFDVLGFAEPSTLKSDIVKMERLIIQAVSYNFGKPVSISFLRRFNMAARSSRQQHTYGKYVIDLALLDASLCHIKPSLIAAAAVYISICVSKSEARQEFWTDTLTYYTTYSFEDIQFLIAKLAQVIIDSQQTVSNVLGKYSSKEFFCTAQKMMQEIDVLKTLSSL